jgi:23S rRNA (guanosine2251-2'-O)-methyltransferase
MEYVDLIQETNLAQALGALKAAGFWVAGLDAEGEVTLWEADLKGRAALVIGNEGRGLRRLVRKHCDYLARIPIGGPISSLNASVSAAVALAEWARQRAQ